MYSDLKNKQMLITGSSSGIGLETAKLAAKFGANIGIHGLEDEPAGLLKELTDLGAGKVQYYKANLKNVSECKTLVESFASDFGGVDVLINNAGGLGGRAPIGEMTEEFYAHVTDLNCKSMIFVTNFAIPFLKKSTYGGSVVSTGSNAGRSGGGPGASLYGATKAFVADAQRTFVKELTADGIRFNIVAPGFIDTSFHADKSAELINKIASNIPMKRPAKPSEVAPSFLFFASNAASGYLTGALLDVNGGMEFTP